MAKQSEDAESPGGGTSASKGNGPEKPINPRKESSRRARSSAARRVKPPVALQKLLKADHARFEGLLRSYQSAVAQQKGEALRALSEELITQINVKEQVLYPALLQADVDESVIDEARVSYDLVKLLLRDALVGGSEDRLRDAKITLLAQILENPVAKEQQPRQGLLAKAAGIEDAAVAARMLERREALEADRGAGMPELRPAEEPYGESGTTFGPREDRTMPQHGPDRDEHGRFVSHDDSRRGRGGYARADDDHRGRDMHSRERRFYEDDDDRHGGRGRGRDHGRGGWFGDREGHSQASRMGWEERRQEGTDRGESGWFGDPRGHADASRRGWETRRREGTEHDSGWHGDPEGHAEASRRGWATRRREGTEHESGWHGDPEGHAEASRRGWETRYREGTEHDSGWHGDPEGHSRASRMGWDTRRREGRGYGHDNDRDYGRSGWGHEARGYGGGQDYGSRGYRTSDTRQERGGQDRGQAHGQGGWFGDSEGHAEASRRGWERRRDDDDDYRTGRGRR